MSLVTVTATAVTTIPVLVTATASLFGLPTTVTTNIYTTVIGVPGQTITILPPPETAGETQLVPSIQDSMLPQPQYTVTITEIDAYVQSPDGSIWTMVFYDETGNAGAPTPTSWNAQDIPGEKVFVLPDLNSGWKSWSTGEKAGLCAGVVLAVLGLLLLWWCCLNRRQEWTIQPRGTYWNGGYWGAGLRGGAGRWNIRQIALKWKKVETARGASTEGAQEAEEDRPNSRLWQTNMQLGSATALDAAREGFLDTNFDKCGPRKALKQISSARCPRNAPGEDSKVQTERSEPYLDDPVSAYPPTRHDQARIYSELAPS